MRLLRLFFLITSVLTTPFAFAFHEGPSAQDFYHLQGTELEVLSELGAPIAGARIMIGYAVNDPFQGNVFSTGKSGTAQIPSLWKTPLPVTISADGHLTATFVDSQPMGRTFVLQRAETEKSYELKGNVNGFGQLRKDGKVDVGFVMPAFNRRELLGFDISSVISPEFDTITILSRNVEIPSNISLPKQDETYIFPITLNKPSYRIFTRHTGQKKFVSGHAQFPLKRVVDKIRAGQSITEVINDFSFLGGGLSTVDMKATPVTKDMVVSDFKYSEKITAKAIPLPATRIMFSVAAIENNGDFFPTDLKYLESNQSMELVTNSTQGTVYVASMLANKPQEKIEPKLHIPDFTLEDVNPWNIMKIINQDPIGVEESAPNLSQMSITLQKYQTGMPAPEFLSFVPPPVVKNGSLELTPPVVSQTILPIGTVVVFSEVETLQRGELSTEKRTRLWEIFSPNWTNRVILPDIEDTLNNQRNRRWEVIYLGKRVGSSEADGLNAVTHISRNSVNVP